MEVGGEVEVVEVEVVKGEMVEEEVVTGEVVTGEASGEVLSRDLSREQCRSV